MKKVTVTVTTVSTVTTVIVYHRDYRNYRNYHRNYHFCFKNSKMVIPSPWKLIRGGVGISMSWWEFFQKFNKQGGTLIWYLRVDTSVLDTVKILSKRTFSEIFMKIRHRDVIWCRFVGFVGFWRLSVLNRPKNEISRLNWLISVGVQCRATF